MIIAFGGAATHLLKFYHVIPPSFWQVHDTSVLAFFVLLFQLLVYVISFKLLVPSVLRVNHVVSNRFRNTKLHFIFLCIILLSFGLLLNFEYIVQPSVARHSGAHKFQQLNLLIGIVTIYLLSDFKLKFFRVRINSVLLVFVLFCLIIYPASTASRTSVVPYAFLFLLSIFHKQFFKASFYFSLSFVVLFLSLASRGDPSFVNFFYAISNFDIKGMYGILLILIDYSFPGSDTVNVLLQSQYDFKSSPHLLPLYLSPTPSSFLPSEALFEMSLSYPLGLDREGFSLNFDLFTEGYYWFGNPGLLVWPLVVVASLGFGLRIHNSRFGYHSRFFANLLLLAIFYMFFGGMVFTIRAGTRFLLLVVIVSVASRQISRLKWG